MIQKCVWICVDRKEMCRLPHSLLKEFLEKAKYLKDFTEKYSTKCEYIYDISQIVDYAPLGMKWNSENENKWKNLVGFSCKKTTCVL